MQYRVGFKNGMVVQIEAESVHDVANSSINFRKGKDHDQDVYVSTSNVLFIAPADRSGVEYRAVAPTAEKKD